MIKLFIQVFINKVVQQQLIKEKLLT